MDKSHLLTTIGIERRTVCRVDTLLVNYIILYNKQFTKGVSMFKKILTFIAISIFFCLSQVSAQPNTLTIYIPFAGGSTTDITCRALFENYSKDHKTTVLFLNYPGSNQIMGHREFIQNTEPALMCAGNGIVFNQLYHKDTSPALSTIKPVTDVLKLTHFILSPASGPNTFAGIIEKARKENKPVIIGAPTLTSSLVISHPLDQLGVKYQVILYKTPQEAIVSLKDGSLNMYNDGGSIKQIGNLEGIQEIAHVSISGDKSRTENLIKRWPELENLASMTIIYARANVSDIETERVSSNIRQTMSSPAMKEYFNKTVPFHNVVPTTPQQSQEKIKKLLKFLNAQQ